MTRPECADPHATFRLVIGHWRLVIHWSLVIGHWSLLSSRHSVLAQRRAFRRMPAERMRAEDYLSADPQAPDCTYVAEASVIEGYEFDRVAFRVVGSTYRSADLVHWLALDVASRALADAGYENGEGLAREGTGVVLGNTL